MMYKDRKPFEVGTFIRHFKREFDEKGTNFLYIYVGTAQHTETLEKLALYRSLYGDETTYVRPLDSFYGSIDKEKYPEAKQEFRFERANMKDLEAIKSKFNI